MDLTTAKKGQVFNIGMTLAYALIVFGLGVFFLGIVLIVFSDTFIGTYVYQYAVSYGVSTSILSWMESIRNFLPFAVGIGILLGAFALASRLS